MYFVDIETLGVSSDSVILSAGIVYADPKENKSFQELIDNSIFVKFNVEEQVSKYGRTVDQVTLDWWGTQSDEARAISFDPNPNTEVTLVEGLELLSAYVTKHEICWQRGTLDSTVLQDCYTKTNLRSFCRYDKWRDVRTAIHLLYNAPSAYVDIDQTRVDFDESAIGTLKHSPVFDAAYDAFMLFYGVEKSKHNSL